MGSPFLSASYHWSLTRVDAKTDDVGAKCQVMRNLSSFGRKLNGIASTSQRPCFASAAWSYACSEH